MPNINVQHLVALVLVDGKLGFDSAHSHERMSDPAVVAMRQKVELVANPELTTALPPRQVIIHIKTKDGGTFTHRTHAVKGTPANPMSRKEVVEKSLDLVCPIIGKDKGGKLVESVLTIEDMKKVADLRPLLQTGG
jgi:2-methylcitrate dehydratase PrpD